MADKIYTGINLDETGVIKDVLTPSLRETGRYEEGSEASRALRGFSRRTGNTEMSIRQDHQGMVMFTKSMCNVSHYNLMANRRLAWLTDTDASSIGCAVKCMMGANPNGSPELGEVRSVHVDDYQAFNPILSSACMSLTGWGDRVNEYWQSDEGIAKQVYVHVDNRPTTWDLFDLTATFKSTSNDIVNGYIQAMWEYQASVASNHNGVVASAYHRAMRRLDYPFRIYRIGLDHSKTYVRKLACTGASIWDADTSGSDMNYNAEEQLNLENLDMTVPIKCMGRYYNDPLIITMFNAAVTFCNALMADGNREANMVKLVGDERYIYDNHGYPRIDPRSLELEWWVPTPIYNALVNGLIGDLV